MKIGPRTLQSVAMRLGALLLPLLLVATTVAPAAATPLAQDDCSASIAGTVTLEDGSVVEGAQVVALPVSATSIRPIDPNQPRVETESDADGLYALEGLCAGTYLVVARLSDPDRPLVGFYDADDDGEPDRVLLEQDDAQRTDVAIMLGEPRRPSQPPPGPRPIPQPQCDMDDGAIEGQVTLEDGTPVEHARVMAFPATASGRSGSRTIARRPAVTDADGRYRIEGLCEGDYHVTAHKRSSTRALQGTHDSDGDGRPDMVALSEDEREAADIDIVLSEPQRPPNAPDPGRPGPPPGPRPAPQPRCPIDDGAIAGIVVDDEGQPVAGVHVLAAPADETPARGSTPVVRPPVTSAEDGTWRIERLCTGDWLLVAWQRDGGTIRVGFHDADDDGAPDPITLTEDAPQVEDVEITLIDVPAGMLPDLGHLLPRPPDAATRW